MTLKRFTKVSLLALAGALVATQAGLVWGLATGTPDVKQIYSFTGAVCNTTLPADGNLNAALQVACPAVTNIKTRDIPDAFPLLDNGLGCLETGTTAAAKAAVELCVAADTKLQTGAGGGCFESGPVVAGVCPGHGAPIGVAGTFAARLADCQAALDPAVGGATDVICAIDPVNSAPFDAFVINFNTFRFSAERCGACTIKKFDADRNDGGLLYDDPPATLLIRLDADTTPRPFSVNVAAPGAPGPGPASFTVNVDSTPGGANPTTDEEMHKAICQGLESAGLTVVPKPPADIGRFLDPPSAGWFIEVKPLSSVAEIGFTPQSTAVTLATQPNLAMQQESVSPLGGPGSVPTLNEWGMGILVAILLMTGVWMLRRRQRLQQV
jgi:hypothetical protein